MLLCLWRRLLLYGFYLCFVFSCVELGSGCWWFCSWYLDRYWCFYSFVVFRCWSVVGSGELIYCVGLLIFLMLLWWFDVGWNLVLFESESGFICCYCFVVYWCCYFFWLKLGVVWLVCWLKCLRFFFGYRLFVCFGLIVIL